MPFFRRAQPPRPRPVHGRRAIHAETPREEAPRRSFLALRGGSAVPTGTTNPDRLSGSYHTRGALTSEAEAPRGAIQIIAMPPLTCSVCPVT